MMQNLMKNNPNIAQAIPIVQKIMNEGGSKEDQLRKACEIANLNYQQTADSLKSNGINLN